jgi:hypothetical protein
MQVVLYGTRGSTPICRSDAVKYGGNTTSLRVKSQCLPQGMALAIDAGSGFVPPYLAASERQIGVDPRVP